MPSKTSFPQPFVAVPIGALNSVLALLEKPKKPSHIVAYSSGNHAQAVAWVRPVFFHLSLLLNITHIWL
jgi:hypothetical protein